MMLTVRSGKMTECVSFVIKSHFGYLLSVTEFEASSRNVDIKWETLNSVWINPKIF